jgi:Putative metallopeptidase
MSSSQSKILRLVVMGIAMFLPNSSSAQSETVAQADQPSRVSIAYVPSTNSALQELYQLLRDRQALERIQEILSPLRLLEELTIKTTECGAVNSWYRRENYKPTVTICYELLKHIMDSVPSETTPAGVTPADA